MQLLLYSVLHLVGSAAAFSLSLSTPLSLSLSSLGQSPGFTRRRGNTCKYRYGNKYGYGYGYGASTLSSTSTSTSSSKSNSSLLDIPQKELQDNSLEIQASAFSNSNSNLEDVHVHVDTHEHEHEHEHDPSQSSIQDFELDLIRQKLEYGAYKYSMMGTEKPLQLHNGNDIIDIIDIDTDSTGIPSTSKPQLKLALYSKVKELSSLELTPVWQARILLLISAALYGTNFTFVKVLNENIPVGFGTALRFALASVVTLPWLFQDSATAETDSETNTNTGIETDISTDISTGATTSGEVQTLNGSQVASMGAILGGVEVGIWNGIGYLSQAVGLETTHASTSAFICSLAVVIVPILDFLTGKQIKARQAIGALLAVVGVAFLELDGLQAGSAAGNGIHLSTGDMLSLVQPFAFGMGFWRMEHYMRKFPTEAMKLTASQLSVIALTSLAFFIATSGGISGLPDLSQVVEWLTNPVILGVVCWTGLVTTALTVYMETIALKTLSAAETTMLLSAEPIFGGACAAVVLGEQFGIGGFIGAAMVLGGCIASNINMGGASDSDGDGDKDE